jgi:hypothetical protein
VNLQPAQPGQWVVMSRAVYSQNRRPMYVYRAPPQKDDDSGWTATVGESPEEIRRTELTTAHVEHLAERWPELRAVFADPRPESEWEWSEADGQYREIRTVGET